VDRGTLRESFILNQLVNARHQVSMPLQTDFSVDGQYVFEVGGKDKSSQQIKGLKNGYVIADDIENGIHNKIPLWLFGFLY